MIAALLMGFWDGMTKNWAEITPTARDPRLRPIVLPHDPRETTARVREILQQLPRWSVESLDEDSGTLHAIHKTRFWHFADDVRLRFRATADGTEITGRSQSRIGSGDLGQNARNLRELADAIRNQ